MIIYNKEKIQRILNWQDDSLYILADFDRTLTSANSQSSWSILYNNENINKEYKNQANQLYEHYRPIEIDESIESNLKSTLMEEWWTKLINLSIKYKISSSLIDEMISDKEIMQFREGTIKLLENFHQRNIPFIIISAGLGNSIKEFLKINNCLFDNIYIISNFIKFNDNIATGIEGDIIHSLNKNETTLPYNLKEILQSRTNPILLGDQIADINMLSPTQINNALKIGFLENNIKTNKKYYVNNFDIVCTDNTTFYDLINEINILYKNTN